MRFKTCLTVIAVSISATFASPASVTSESGLFARAASPNQSGVHDGFYYTWWTDGQTDGTYNNGPGGSYSVSWANGKGDLYGGKGWKPGSLTRIASYRGQFNPIGNGYLGLYGFTNNPDTEYHVMESYGTYNPTTGFPVRGTFTCNGANYDIIRNIRTPSGIGNSLLQIHSIRNPKLPLGEVSGTIEFACHVAGWASLGIKLGTGFDFQIIATEGYFSSGASNITVS